jgi:hypothetical protein
MRKIDDTPFPYSRCASRRLNRRSAVAKSPPQLPCIQSARKVLEGMRRDPAFFELDF